MTSTSSSTSGTVLPLPKPNVVIKKELMDKLHHWVQRGGSHECSGMGKVVIEKGVVHVVDAWMVKQSNTGTETEMDADHLARLLYQKRDVPGSMSFWWHSHASMAVFWSGTDTDQIAKLSANGLCVALVLNTKGEIKCCIATGGDNAPAMHVDDVNVTVEREVPEELKTAWNAEYDENVTPKALTTLGGRYSSRFDDYESFWSGSDFTKKNTNSTPESEVVEVGDKKAILRRKIKLMDASIEALERCVVTGIPTKWVCHMIGVKYQPEITVEWSLGGKTIEDLIVAKIDEMTLKMSGLIDEVRTEESTIEEVK